MMKTLSARLIAGVVLLGCLPMVASAATMSFGPTPYLKLGDAPASFCPDCDIQVETFEDNMLDSFLTISNGSILPPNSMSGLANPVTDSVDGDDGSVDGNGNGGYSWFTGTGRSNDYTLTIDFDAPVHCAGLVFTDGDTASSNIKLEALDAGGNIMATINGGDLADEFYTGETAEDSFMGFSDMDGISALRLIMNAGEGIEIDHIHWGNCPVPEPATGSMVLIGLLGLAGMRRRR